MATKNLILATAALIGQFHGTSGQMVGINDKKTPTQARVIRIDGVDILFTAGRVDGQKDKFHVYAEFRTPDGGLGAFVRSTNGIPVDGKEGWMTYTQACEFLDSLDDSYGHLGDLLPIGWNFAGPEIYSDSALEQEAQVIGAESRSLAENLNDDEIDTVLNELMGRAYGRQKPPTVGVGVTARDDDSIPDPDGSGDLD